MLQLTIHLEESLSLVLSLRIGGKWSGILPNAVGTKSYCLSACASEYVREKGEGKRGLSLGTEAP